MHYQRWRKYGTTDLPERTPCPICGEPRGNRSLCNKCYRRDYYERNRERENETARLHYLARVDEMRARSREWRLAHPKRRRELQMRRKARERATQIEPVDYVAILAEHGMFCHICSLVIVDESDLHFDHVIPLSKGGPHVADNIRPAHAICNMRKGSKVA